MGDTRTDTDEGVHRCRPRRSWASMLRTARAPVAVLLLGGIGLTVPPQTHDMLAFLGADRIWGAASFQLALAVLGGSAWFWSRAVLAARFGINDRQRSGTSDAGFDWTAFTWLPRLVLVGTFLLGVAIAVEGRSPWAVVGAAAVGALALLLTVIRPRGAVLGPPPAPRDGIGSWIRGGARARLSALLRRAPYGAAPALALLALGLVPLALGLVEAFTSVLRLPNRLATVFPGPAVAVLLLGLMIGPLTAVTFTCDGLTLRARLGRLRLGLRRPPVLGLILLYVFVVVPALFDVHTVRTSVSPQYGACSLTSCSSGGSWIVRPAPARCSRSSSQSQAEPPEPGFGARRCWTRCYRRSSRAGRPCSR